MDAFITLYKSLVRSHLEYAVQVWSPYTVARLMVPSICHMQVNIVVQKSFTIWYYTMVIPGCHHGVTIYGSTMVILLGDEGMALIYFHSGTTFFHFEPWFGPASMHASWWASRHGFRRGGVWEG